MGRTQRRRLRQQRMVSLPAADEPTNDYLSALHRFLHANGWRNDTQLAVRHFPNTGRGIHSKSRKFQSGDELIRLPSECLISVGSVEADDVFKTQFVVEKFDDQKKVSFQALLAWYLLYQQHMEKMGSSPISGYLLSLPTNYTTPYFCTLAELQCLPEAILECTVAQNRKIRDSFNNLKSVFGAQEECACCGLQYFKDIYTLAEFKYAYFAVNTRSIFLNARQLKPRKSFFQPLLLDDSNMALAPFLDLFNHSDRVQTKATFLQRGNNPAQFDYVLTLEHSTQDVIKPYNQLHIRYGTYNNLKLLTEYGFFMPQNAHDYFEFSLLDIENLIKSGVVTTTGQRHRNIFKFIREHNLSDQMFVHLAEGCSHNLHVVLHLFFKQESFYPNVLNQIVFGDASQLEDIGEECRALVDYKIQEYARYVCALQELPALSASGEIALEYMLECVRYLKAYKETLSDFNISDDDMKSE